MQKSSLALCALAVLIVTSSAAWGRGGGFHGGGFGGARIGARAVPLGFRQGVMHLRGFDQSFARPYGSRFDTGYWPYWWYGGLPYSDDPQTYYDPATPWTSQAPYAPPPDAFSATPRTYAKFVSAPAGKSGPAGRFSCDDGHAIRLRGDAARFALACVSP